MKILLIDGSNVFIRNYAVVPTLDPHGNSIGGVYGFITSLSFYVYKTKPDKIFVCWDGPNGSKRRRQLIENYKSNRKPIRLNRNYEFEQKDVNENKKYQQIRLINYLKNLPLTQILISDIEADDVIGCLCQVYQDEEKVIVSGDKDYYQLLDSKTLMFKPQKKDFFTSQDCYEEYNIYPINFALAKAIVGDKSDNIKGLKGVGFKKLIKLFPQFTQEEKVTVDQLVEYAREKNEKYNVFLESTQVVNNNLKAIRLDESIISFSNFNKIQKATEHKSTLKIIPFRMMLVQDGIMNLGDNFFKNFKYLM